MSTNCLARWQKITQCLKSARVVRLLTLQSFIHTMLILYTYTRLQMHTSSRHYHYIYRMQCDAMRRNALRMVPQHQTKPSPSLP